MSHKMKPDDEVRLNILSAMLEKTCTQPNLRRIKSKTKYHLATIKSSIDFLQDENILMGYGPKVAFWELGYKLEAVELLQLDFSKEEKVKKYLDSVKEDPHIYYFGTMMGSGNYNVVSFQFYKDVESHHKNFQERYIKKLPFYYEVVKDRQVFYLTDPIFKRGSRTNSLIKMLREKAGLEPSLKNNPIR